MPTTIAEQQKAIRACQRDIEHDIVRFKGEPSITAELRLRQSALTDAINTIEGAASMSKFLKYMIED